MPDGLWVKYGLGRMLSLAVPGEVHFLLLSFPSSVALNTDFCFFMVADSQPRLQIPSSLSSVDTQADGAKVRKLF